VYDTKPNRAENSLIPAERIEKAIYVLRGQRIMLDEDLAELYGVTPKRLNEQVKRNRDRFPSHFMLVDNAGVHGLEVAICDLKMGRTTDTPLRIHRTWNCHVGQCTEQCDCDPSE
jgi:hypothetical protein